MAANEDELLRRFQASPTPDALRELLIVHQDRIYNACFQVLGRAADAEDAAQEALMKVAEGARTARDGDAFRGWIYRVSFRIALDHWRRREATRLRESRTAMNRPTAPPLDDRERLALFEAMDGLDDRERSLLLEHYFEKVPLADLGERRGVSAVEIWQRIDRAREKLKKKLLGAGFVVVTSRVSEALESSVPAAAPTSLLTEAVLSRILAGGIAVGVTKISMTPVIAIALAVFFALITGGVLVMRSSRGASKPSHERTAGKSRPAPAAYETAANPVGPYITDEPPTADSATESALSRTLERYRAWHKEWKEASLQPPDPNDPNRVLRLQYEGFQRFPDARKQIFAEIDTFLEFLKDPENEPLLDNLVINLLGGLEQRGSGGAFSRPQKYGDFPRELMEGFYVYLQSPNAAQQGILRLLGSVHDVPEKFDHAYEQLMYSSDTGVQYLALWSRWRQRPLELPTLEKYLERYESATDTTVRQIAISAISYSPRPETLRWMLDQMESGRDVPSMQRIASAAATMAGKMNLDAGSMERLVRNLTTTFGTFTTEGEQSWMLWSVLSLAPKDSARILQATLPKGVTPKLKSAMEATLAEATKDSVTANQLQNFFRQRMK